MAVSGDLIPKVIGYLRQIEKPAAQDHQRDEHAPGKEVEHPLKIDQHEVQARADAGPGIQRLAMMIERQSKGEVDQQQQDSRGLQSAQLGSGRAVRVAQGIDRLKQQEADAACQRVRVYGLNLARTCRPVCRCIGYFANAVHTDWNAHRQVIHPR